MFDYYLGWALCLAFVSFSYLWVRPLAKFCDEQFGWDTREVNCDRAESKGCVKLAFYWWVFRALAVFCLAFAYFGEHS